MALFFFWMLLTFGQTTDPKIIYKQAFKEQLQMLKGEVEQGAGLINPNLTEEQKIRHFNSTVGQSTQGQVQQIVNNLLYGNSNSYKDIPEK